MNLSDANRCKVAFVGAGNMAVEHIKAFRAILGVDLTGIFSRTRKRAEGLAREFGIATTCDSLAELYEKTNADLVVIAVSELSVRAVAEECFAFPWVCLIEKPAGYNLADAEALASTAQLFGRRAYVALNRRHYSSTQTVVQDLAADEGPRYIHVQDQENVIAALKAGRPRLVVDNWMYANSIHVIDYFSVLGRGTVTQVEPFTRWNAHDPGLVGAKISFDSGDIGLYEAVWNRPGPWAVAVTTPTKRWEMRPLEQAAVQLYGERKLTFSTTHEWDQQFKPGLRRQAELAVRAALGSSTPELPTLDDALVSMRLTRAIYEPM